MAMGCHAIVAEPLTITGSIGVVAAKFNLAEVYGKAGFNKQVISRGRCALQRFQMQLQVRFRLHTQARYQLSARRMQPGLMLLCQSGVRRQHA